jgi:hypothetical protein
VELTHITPPLNSHHSLLRLHTWARARAHFTAPGKLPRTYPRWSPSFLLGILCNLINIPIRKLKDNVGAESEGIQGGNRNWPRRDRDAPRCAAWNGFLAQLRLRVAPALKGAHGCMLLSSGTGRSGSGADRHGCEARDQGPEGVLDSPLRSPREINAVDMPGSAAVEEIL